MSVRRRAPAAAVVSDGAAAIVLGGWSAKPQGWTKGQLDADDAIFELFQSGLAGVVALWRQHAAYLRGQASRLGIEAQWDGRFFGEFCESEEGEA